MRIQTLKRMYNSALKKTGNRLVFRGIVLLFFLTFLNSFDHLYANQREIVPSIDVIVINDTTGSMFFNDPALVRRLATLMFVDLLSPQDRFHLISYNNSAYHVFPSSADFENATPSAKEAIKSVHPTENVWYSNQGTYHPVALEAALEVLKKSGSSKKIIIWLTDGVMHLGDESKRKPFVEKLAQTQAKLKEILINIESGQETYIHKPDEQIIFPIILRLDKEEWDMLEEEIYSALYGSFSTLHELEKREDSEFEYGFTNVQPNAAEKKVFVVENTFHLPF